MIRGLEENGWFASGSCVPDALLDQIAAECGEASSGSRRRGGIRNLLELPGVCDLVDIPAVRDLASACVGDGALVVRGLLFDKTATSNWKVPWHQDLTIAVRERCEAPDFGAWSRKEGVLHLQASAMVLERMVAIRVHIDPCGLDNGPVRVLPGSHLGGRLSAAEIEDWVARTQPVACAVPRGGILAFRPLLLHASSPAKAPGHRRVVHLEFASGPLPHGLAWHARI